MLANAEVEADSARSNEDLHPISLTSSRYACFGSNAVSGKNDAALVKSLYFDGEPALV